MDPDANLTELIARLEYSTDSEAGRALDLLEALVGWIAGAGHAPNWRKAKRACELAQKNIEARAELAESETSSLPARDEA